MLLIGQFPSHCLSPQLVHFFGSSKARCVVIERNNAAVGQEAANGIKFPDTSCSAI